MKNFKFILIFLIILILPINLVNAFVGSESNLDKYVKPFYNRYSQHFDEYGLKYMSPSYGIEDFKDPVTAREWMSLASYYKYTNNQDVIHNAIIQAYREISKRPSYTQSFNDAEAFFLMIRLMENNEDLSTYIEKERVFDLMSAYLEQGIKAKDTENRAIIASAHWQYITDYLYSNNRITNKIYFDGLIKEKIDKAIQESINKDGWYFENNMKSFTPHYHAVSAFMLLIYGDLTQQSEYLDLSKKMYFNIKKITFKNGMVEAKLGHRPLGLGAQFYLTQALLGQYFNDDDYKVYLFYASGNRFFSDKQYPNRLEFHSTIENTQANYHDDYAFSDIAELGLVVPKLKNINLEYKYYLSNPIKYSKDNTFKIYNYGKLIFFNWKKNILGSYGNWSHIL
jgi:hypothetical protein